MVCIAASQRVLVRGEHFLAPHVLPLAVAHVFHGAAAALMPPKDVVAGVADVLVIVRALQRGAPVAALEGGRAHDLRRIYTTLCLDAGLYAKDA